MGKRITELEETSQLQNGDFVIIDNNAAGNAKYNLGAMIANTYTKGEVDDLLLQKLDEDGDGKDNVETFTSSDVADGSASAWTSVSELTSGEVHSSIFAKVSQMFKNVRFLWKLIGSDSFSNVASTLSGAIGNTALTTTAQTLSGAIVEHESDISTLNSKVNGSERWNSSCFCNSCYQRFVYS